MPTLLESEFLISGAYNFSSVALERKVQEKQIERKRDIEKSHTA